jgi:hypothetical protein
MSRATRDLLAHSFRHTTYRVFTDPPIDIRIGTANTDLEHLLRTRQVRSWAFITACNPGSQPLNPQENLARHCVLREAVATRHLASVEGQALADRNDWPAEQSLLILGINRTEALALGHQFGQLAIVYGRAGSGAELLWCDDSTEAC